MPRFAANLSMMFTEVPFLDRFEAAAKAGFTAVEFLFPYEFPAREIGDRLHRHGLTQALFNLPPGDWAAGEKGFAALPARFADLQRLAAPPRRSRAWRRSRSSARRRRVPFPGLDTTRAKRNAAFFPRDAARRPAST